MKNYDFSKDMKTIRELLSLTQDELSHLTNIPRITIARAEKNEHFLSDENLEKFYDFVFKEKIFLNRVESDILIERNSNPVLFHGSKEEIKEDLCLKYAKENSDFGKAFYLGENYNQAAEFIQKFNGSSVYAFVFDDSNMQKLEFEISNEWMIAILYYRGRLEKYKNHPYVKSIISKINQYDYIVAPIADNDMYQILNMFAQGSITDEQCKHALAASNLGKQIVFFKEETLKHLSCIKRFYLCESERASLEEIESTNKVVSKQKADLSIIEYRREGKYIDELFK